MTEFPKSDTALSVPTRRHPHLHPADATTARGRARSGWTGLSVTSHLTPQYRERYTFHYMTSPSQPTAFRLDPALLAALQKIRRRDGVPISEQVRRALQAWIGSRDVVRAVPRRTPTRRKA